MAELGIHLVLDSKEKQALTIFFSLLKLTSSPYITQFSQPDSIIPDLYNPQSLNRYAYTLNNPIRYTDPTGHRICEDIEGQCLSEKQATNKWISDHTPKPKPKKQEQDDRLLIEDGEYTLRGWGKSLVSWDGEKEIDPSDWEDLLFSIGEDVHDFSTGWYDTPFYDGFGTLSGTACINGKCADRSEINYIGEGEALAALGLTKKQTFQVVAIWKHGMYDQAPTSDTFYFTETGWDYYNDHYSTPSHSLPIFQKMITPFIQTGTPMIMPFLLP